RGRLFRAWSGIGSGGKDCGYWGKRPWKPFAGAKLAGGQSGEDTQAPEAGPPPAPEFLAGHPVQFLEGLADRLSQEPCGLVVVRVRPARGLGDDRVDHAQLEAVAGVGLERRPGLPP